MSRQTRDQRPTTVRGPELRKKIIESGIEGEEFRSQNQGTDMIDNNIKHEKSTTSHRAIKEQTKK